MARHWRHSLGRRAFVRGLLGGAIGGGAAIRATPALTAGSLTVAAASDLQSVLPEIVGRFERETGQTVRVTFGSSGNFFAQIQNGAPFDIYFSADIEYPRRLAQASLADPDSLRTYAVGRLALWTTRASGVDVHRGLSVLDQAAVRRIAIANPEHAPYGRAAVEALQRAGLYDRVRAKLVLGENVSQAAQFVQSGNAQAGIVALSIALAPAMANAGIHVAIDSSLYTPIEQAAIIVRSSTNKTLARDFLAFFQRPDTVALLTRFGFTASTTPSR